MVSTDPTGIRTRNALETAISEFLPRGFLAAAQLGNNNQNEITL